VFGQFALSNPRSAAVGFSLAQFDVAVLRARLWDVETPINEHREELRDKFAAAALTALLSHLPASGAFAARPDKRAEDVAHDKLASEAYRWADAMLVARIRPSEPSDTD
jgi:hypothetical protein